MISNKIILEIPEWATEDFDLETELMLMELELDIEDSYLDEDWIEY